jgi:membrane protease YdiL (CAAX protease family)
MADRSAPIKLTAAQYRVIGIALVVAVVSLAISLKYFRRTFPEATLDLRVNREDSEKIAQSFLAARGLKIDGYRHTAIFTYDDDTKLFLEKTLGLDRLNQLTSGPVHLWRWSDRWFRPQQQEEYDVDVAPGGQIVHFRHVIPESQAGANLELNSAQEIAESFLSKATGLDLRNLELLESQTNKRPARTDYVFTWKREGVDLGDGSLRISVSVAGDVVTGYSEFVKIPEQWSRDYERLRSRNNSAQIVDEVFFYLLSVAMIVMLIRRLRDRDVPVRTALGFGLVGAVLYFLSQLNTFPLAESSYRTTDSYSSFTVNYFIGSALSALGVATFIFLLLAASEPEYRESFPRLISLPRALTWKGIRTRSFLIANVVGLAMAFFFFGYQTVFYFCANRLGAWAPSDIPFTNELNTRIPWMGVLFMGFLPAVSEELQFRAFAIPFLARFTRSLPVAIVLAAFNWGFLHSAYPNQPFFIRGLEVGLGGIIVGFVMLRFGIVATLIWHYSVDALYSAFLLLRSPNHYLVFSGAVTAGIMCVPLIAALAAYLITGTFADESSLTNAEQSRTHPQRPPETQAAPAEITYSPLTRPRLALAGVLIVIFLILALIPVYRFGEETRIRMTAQEAAHAGDVYLRSQGIDPAKYHRVVQLVGNAAPLTIRYFVEHISLKQADQVYRSATQMYVWEIRYFRPLEIEEHHVFFDATNGQFVDHRLVLDENAPGASLDPNQARSLSESALTSHGYRLSDFELQDWRAEKRKAREDYNFTWQAKPQDPRNVDEAKYRVQVQIAGSQVVSVSDSFKLPEEWERRQLQSGLSNSILQGFDVLLGIIFFTQAIILFVLQLRGAGLPWRLGAKIGACVFVLALLSEFNAFATLERSYQTSIPLSTFQLQVGAGLVLLPIMAGLAAWLLAALVFSLFPEAQGSLRRSATRPWRRDAAVAVLLVFAMEQGRGTILALLTSKLPTYFPPQIDLVPNHLDSWSPALGSFVSALLASIFAASGVALAIAIFRSGWSRRAWWFWLGGVALLVGLGPTNAHSFREYLLGWSVAAVGFALFIWVVTMFFRDNALAYVAGIFCLFAARPIEELIHQGARLYVWNGVLLGAFCILLLARLLSPQLSALKRAKMPPI